MGILCYTKNMKLYGDYHVHSEFSRDATGTIDEIVRIAKEKGLAEIAISDHGSGLGYGVSPKHYKQIRALIDKAKAEHGIDVYFGIESNLLGTDGQIDAYEEHRREFDLVLCGIHPRTRAANLRSWFSFFLPNMICMTFRIFSRSRRRKNTEAMKKVIERNDIDIWVHPNRFFKLDVVEVAKTCADRGTLIELNGKGVSFRPIDFERMIALGAKFVISSDAHNPKQIARTDRVAEFLKSCDYSPDDIINLTGRFRRGDAKLLEKVQARFTDESTTETKKTRKELRSEKKAEKQRLREKYKREKMIKRKKD